MTGWMKTEPSATLCHLWICSHIDHTYEKTLWFMYLCPVQMLVVQEGNGKAVDLQTHHYLNLFHTNTNINQAEDYKTIYQARKMFCIRREMQLPFSISLFTKCTEWYTFIFHSMRSYVVYLKQGKSVHLSSWPINVTE